MGDCKSVKIKNAIHISRTKENIKVLVGGPLLVGGLGAGPPAPLISGPDIIYFMQMHDDHDTHY